MALSTDYNIYRDNAGMGAVIHTGGNVLYGAGSLEMSRVTAGNNIVAIRKNTPRNFASGRARFLWGKANGALGDNSGFAFNLSQEDITGGAGTGYYFSMAVSGATWTPSVYALTAGLGTKTLLAQGTALTPPTAPQSLPLEIEWRVDVETLGGVNLICRRGAVGAYLGTTLNWSTLLTVTAINYLQTSSYYTTSAGEGPAINLNGAGGLYYFDEITVVPLLVGGITT